MKWVTALIALSLLFLLSDVTHAAKLEDAPQSTERRELVFNHYDDFSQQTMITGKWNNKVYAVKIQIPSLELILTYDKDSIDVNGKSQGYSKPKLVEIFMCKKIPQYPGNTTCPGYAAFELTHPGLTTRMCDFMAAVITGTWKKCCGVTTKVVDKTWNGLQHIWTGMVEWTSSKITWLSELTWNGAKYFGELLWNGAEWLAEFVWKELQRLAEFTINGAYWFAKMARDKAAELVEIMRDGIIFLTKPFVPVLTYVTNVAVEIYTGYLHAHMKNVQARFVFLTLQDGLHAIAACLVVNFACLVLYRLLVAIVYRTTSFIGRKWQEYKDRRAAANLPPEPKKPIWRPKQKKKKKNNNKW